MSNDSEIMELAESLRTFEGSDALGNGDFSALRKAADLLERLASQPTSQSSGGALPFYNNTDGWKRLADNILATYRPHEQAAIQKAIATILADSFEQTEIPAHAIRSGGEG